MDVPLEHCCLSGRGEESLSDARLTDRQRIAIVFEGACLLAHLEGSGYGVDDWSGPILSDGRLAGLRGRVVPSRGRPQDGLAALLAAAFRSEEAPAGRGEGRRIARELFERWRSELSELKPTEIVDDLARRAGFLWRAELGEYRKALAAGHPTSPGGLRVTVLGPTWFRRSLLAGDESDLAEVEHRLASLDGGRLWARDPRRGDAGSLIEQGRWRQAVRLWEIEPPEDAAARLSFARCLYAVGRFQDALANLKGRRSPEARLLRLWTLVRLNKLGRAVREIDRLEDAGLTSRQRMQLVSAAIRVFANLGRERDADRWLERALADEAPEARLRARIFAALRAWDRGRLDQIDGHLEASRAALESQRLGWRWLKAEGLGALARGDGDAAAASFARALGGWRRSLTPFEAGALWNELAMARVETGDLSGAERAMLHALRLHRDAQGSRNATFLRFNLAEVRLRRGRTAGVRAVLEAAAKADRRARNWRSYACDLEMLARYELARGRPHAALLKARAAAEELEHRQVAWRSGVLRVVAARALGWLERPEAAAEELAGANAEAIFELEAEEVPALWALAGDRERALAEAPAGFARPLWTKVLSGEALAAQDWEALAGAEAYRAGRLVFDLELLEPGISPPHVLRAAVVALREAGAGPLAERLDRRDSSSWKALRDFLLEPGEAGRDVTELFSGAGYPQVRLTVETDRGSRILVDGRGGPARSRRRVGGAEYLLETPFLDPTQEALFALVTDGYSADRAPEPAGRPRAPLVGSSPALREALERAQTLAPAEVPILIHGETGTGKELLARYVHAVSPRQQEAFVAMNCAAVAEDLLMSDLFGHVKGAFTGAARDRAGVFETARGGTVFLDEIGDLPLRAQGFLLRVLQEGEVRRVGETLPRKTDVRVVAATHRDLESMVKSGEFRADLYYRLRVGRLRLAPLKERGDDVLLLAEHFLADGRGRPARLSDAARRQLAAYSWPGNVRELKNVLDVAVAYARNGEILPEHLDLPYQTGAARIGYHEKVQRYRRSLVEEALRAEGGNRAAAARRLGLTRQALSYLAAKLDLDA